MNYVYFTSLGCYILFLNCLFFFVCSLLNSFPIFGIDIPFSHFVSVLKVKAAIFHAILLIFSPKNIWNERYGRSEHSVLRRTPNILIQCLPVWMVFHLGNLPYKIIVCWTFVVFKEKNETFRTKQKCWTTQIGKPMRDAWWCALLFQKHVLFKLIVMW